MPQASDYAHIRAWSEHLGITDEGYTRSMSEQAAEENAPLDALYRRTDGTYATVAEIKNEERRGEVDTRAKEIQDAEDARRAEEAEAERVKAEQEAADATRNADQETESDPEGGVDPVQAERDDDRSDIGSGPEPGAE